MARTKKIPAKKTPGKRGGGRNRLELDPEMAHDLAMIGCTDVEIAAAMKVSIDTFIRRKKDQPEFSEALERGRKDGRRSLRRMQWQAAQKGNTAMLIWLGKQLLGQRDFKNVEHSGDPERPITISQRHDYSDDELDAIIAEGGK